MLHPFQGHSQEFVKMVVEIIVVVFRIVQDMSEQSLEFNRMPDGQYIPDRCRRRTCLSTDNRPGTYTTYRAQRAYREDHRERDQHRRR